MECSCSFDARSAQGQDSGLVRDVSRVQTPLLSQTGNVFGLETCRPLLSSPAFSFSFLFFLCPFHATRLMKNAVTPFSLLRVLRSCALLGVFFSRASLFELGPHRAAALVPLPF